MEQIKHCATCGKSNEEVKFSKPNRPTSYCNKCFVKRFGTGQAKPQIIFKTKREEIKDAQVVFSAVCNAYGITTEEMKQKTRKAKFKDPRQMAWKILTDVGHYSRRAIGRLFPVTNGKKITDHSTVYYGLGRVESLIASELETMERYKFALALINGEDE